MQNLLLQPLARAWRWLRRRAFGLVAKNSPPEDSSVRSVQARARFWAELRAGQQEAEARHSSSRP